MRRTNDGRSVSCPSHERARRTRRELLTVQRDREWHVELALITSVPESLHHRLIERSDAFRARVGSRSNAAQERGAPSRLFLVPSCSKVVLTMLSWQTYSAKSVSLASSAKVDEPRTSTLMPPKDWARVW